MTPEQKAAYIIAQAAALSAHVTGMVAENQVRIAGGDSLAYDEAAFDTVIARYCVEHNEVLSFLEELCSS